MRITVLGAGAWGTALAAIAAENRHDVTLWGREPHVVDEINSDHRNTLFLPNATLPAAVHATTVLEDTIGSDLVVIAVPTQHIRSTLSTSDVLRGAHVVSVAKGIEVGTHLRVSQILESLRAGNTSFGVLSGPSHAEEVIARMPTTVVAASTLADVALLAQHVFSTDVFRVYTSDDVTGVEVCGALKNVIAIAAGIVDGLGMGDNTKAALITRGLAEISRLGVALGAQQQTFYGLAGLGDLIVTCASRHSRNRFVGDEIGKGRTLQDILMHMTAVAEGVPTTRAALELASTLGVELPITEKVAAILFDGEEPRSAIRNLMLRPVKAE
ncbi:MAG: NAD(P)H-dependent glycerol-3-phosphate dehydrogenase [bacterium]|nr:NAD(P)H-dependent glycerol-3-phosphate dehydrogenase [bacterium]